MGAFAAFLKKSGVEVTGSDQNIYPPMSDVLAAAGVRVYTPFAAANLDAASPDLVIVGNVIRKVNPEMEGTVARGISFDSLPGALERMILPDKHPMVVAGTHGKTTTSGMLAWVLEKLGESPSFFVGGVLRNFPESFRVTGSRYMVLEGDEYDTAYFDKVPKFTHYCPKDVILTSVEYDHADIYPNIQSVIAAFDRLADLVPPTGFFIACAEYEAPLRIAHRSRAQVATYGFGLGVDSRATAVDLGPAGASFKWTFQNREHKVRLAMTGKHNVLNALGCLTLVAARGLDVDGAIEAMATFEGVKRRQEVFGQAAGITLIDDFAHHPTAVRETIAAIRAKYPQARLIACFEPRSATSRRKIFQQAYSESFDGADLVFVAAPYQPAGTPAATPNADTFSTEELLSDLAGRGKRARLLETGDKPLREFARDLKSGDVVLVMSNGGFDGLLPRLLRIISG
jgi:UDP-N-acetylmuramate: L-alanyl-gamma-D-glutamyl-meso-diaminopimelate ligase